MNIFLGALALLSALVLTSTAVSLLALRRARKLLREIEERRQRPATPAADSAQSELRQALESLAAQVHELRSLPPAAPGDPAAARPGLNLSRRSQALRMHRRGESAEQIASALQVPRQEVDLLVKVHRIVLSNV
ncbi:MAG: hypothetical protein JST11_21930 [Acidobacteria bacterium]|nr:hypothetical protein [Acidobacteriota bacterium]